MRIAVISDILGNCTALEAVLGAIEALDEPVDRILCAGDTVGLGPQPNEVLDLLQDKSIETVMGNYDDAVASGRSSSGVDFPDAVTERMDQEAVAWTRRTLAPQNLAFLEALPRDIRVFPTIGGVGVQRNDIERTARDHSKSLVARSIFGSWMYKSRPRPAKRVKRVLLVHGSPRALNERIPEDAANSILEYIGRGVDADLLISGHCGQSYQRSTTDMSFVGVGPVSSLASPGYAQFVVIDAGTEPAVEFDGVDYDAALQARLMAERGMPPVDSASKSG